MLAAWLNVPPDKIPPENLAHTNEWTMAAWRRVGEAAREEHTPTQWAYDQACADLHAARIEELERREACAVDLAREWEAHCKTAEARIAELERDGLRERLDVAEEVAHAEGDRADRLAGLLKEAVEVLREGIYLTRRGEDRRHALLARLEQNPEGETP